MYGFDDNPIVVSVGPFHCCCNDDEYVVTFDMDRDDDDDDDEMCPRGFRFLKCGDGDWNAAATNRLHAAPPPVLRPTLRRIAYPVAC